MKNHAKGKKASLTEERIEKLQLLDFEWNLNGWYASYCELVEFAATHGYCNVPRLDGNFGKMGFVPAGTVKEVRERKEEPNH